MLTTGTLAFTVKQAVILTSSPFPILLTHKLLSHSYPQFDHAHTQQGHENEKQIQHTPMQGSMKMSQNTT